MAVALAASIAGAPARALVSLNEGHDKIYVNAAVSVGHDSNVFANHDSPADTVYSTAVSADYARRAGWIGVNANVAVNSSRFGSVKGQDFDNPSFNLEFTKQTGRTTGALSLSAARESRADAAVNVRSTSWNVPVGLHFKYPVTGTYTVAGALGYSSRRYVNEAVFASLVTYDAAVDVLHMLSTERDMIAGYRYRFNDTSRNTSSVDHGFSLGLSGRLIRGVMGNLRLGYQTRLLRGIPGGNKQFDSWTASGSSSYAISKKFSLHGTLAKDFSTTATDSSVDNTTATLDAQYAYNSRWTVAGSASVGDSRFLGETGRVVISAGPPPLLGVQRHDNYLSWTASLNYSMNEHLKAALAYAWFENWSSYSYADFVRASWSLTISTRW